MLLRPTLIVEASRIGGKVAGQFMPGSVVYQASSQTYSAKA